MYKRQNEAAAKALETVMAEILLPVCNRILLLDNFRMHLNRENFYSKFKDGTWHSLRIPQGKKYHLKGYNVSNSLESVQLKNGGLFHQ